MLKSNKLINFELKLPLACKFTLPPKIHKFCFSSIQSSDLSLAPGYAFSSLRPFDLNNREITYVLP